MVRELHPDLDARRWQRGLAAYREGAWKLIAGSDGGRELFEISSDPLEAADCGAAEPARAATLFDRLTSYLGSLSRGAGPGAVPEMSDEDRHRLRSLGYLGDAGADQPNAPATRSAPP